MGRWDRFHEARSLSAAEWLSGEVLKTLQEDLAAWPPPVEQWVNERIRQRYAVVLAPDCPRPTLRVFQTAIRLALWELERNYEALDEFAREERSLQVATGQREQLCLEFLHRWLTDSALELLEVSVLKRPHLIACLRRLESGLLLR